MRAKLFPHHVCCLLENNSHVWEKGAVERSMWLCVVRLSTLARCCSCAKSDGPMRPLASKGVPREAQVQEQQHGRKTVGRRSFDTGPCRVVFPGTHHVRNRRITEMSVIVLGQRKVKTNLCKRPSHPERKFRIVGLCKCLFDVTCMKHQIGTYTCVGEGKQVKQAASAKSRRLRKTRVLFLSWLSVMLRSWHKVGRRPLICAQQPIVQ